MSPYAHVEEHSTQVGIDEFIDTIYIFDAEISNPYERSDVMWENGKPVLLICVESSDLEVPYIKAIEEAGFRIVGMDSDWNYILEQDHPEWL